MIRSSDFSCRFTYITINDDFWFPSMSPIEAYMFGALISAVDPVATLCTFAQLQVDPKLETVVFGESLVNDAMSISSNKAKAMHRIDRMLRDLEETSKQAQRLVKTREKSVENYGSFFSQVEHVKTSKETFSKFQETHASEIARQSTGLRLTPSRIRGAVKSRRRVVDRFGLCHELDTCRTVQGAA